ncbi:MAG: hypothetical protein LQ346_001763 [Caloplaca aetnensis]|nr:MAG: hypothetical protein LQ346_001763 [Caloplaca aetnensis]
MKDLSNEVLLMIFQHVSRRDLKAVRLTCRSFALLGARNFFKTLYISPHVDDIEVFNEITERPHMCDPVMNLVFVTAGFTPGLTMEEYTSELYAQLISDEYECFRAACPNIRRLLHLMDGSVSPAGYESCRDVPGFAEGFRKYTLLADESASFFRDSFDDLWFSEVYDGIEAIRSIGTVTFANPFDLNYRLSESVDELHGTFFAEERPQSSDHRTGGRISPGHDGYHPKTELDAAIRLDPCAPQDCIAINRRVVGSPTSRSWSFANLQPTSLRFEDHEMADIINLRMWDRESPEHTLYPLEWVELLQKVRGKPLQTRSYEDLLKDFN